MESSLKSDWRQYYIDLGTVKARKSQKVIFERDSPTPKIKKVITSCNCVLATARAKKIVVNFTPANIPKHLEFQGFYSTTKRISVIYEDGSSDELLFIAKISK